MTPLNDVENRGSRRPVPYDREDCPGNGITVITKPDSAQFLNDLAGIGTGAYLDMRQADVPDYEDWRDSNFIEDGAESYVSPEGQTYAEDELQRIHGMLSQEAWDPQVSRLFTGAELTVGGSPDLEDPEF